MTTSMRSARPASAASLVARAFCSSQRLRQVARLMWGCILTRRRAAAPVL